MKKQIKILLMLISAFIVLNVSCRKNDHPGSTCDQPATGGYNADLQNEQAVKAGANVPAKWYALAIQLSRTTPNQNVAPINARAFGYMGIAFYESVVPGLPKYQSIQKQLNGVPDLPKINCGELYFYPATANAALANMVHHMFGNTSQSQNFTIDSLENSFNTMFGSIVPKNVLDRSALFGQDISNAVYGWSVSDGGDQGYLNLYPTSYVPPAGEGLWVPQPGQWPNCLIGEITGLL